MSTKTAAGDDLAARLNYLQAVAEGAQSTPEAFDLSVVMGDFGRALGALEAVLATAAKHEHGATRWEDPLPVPSWVPEVRQVISQWMLRRDQ